MPTKGRRASAYPPRRGPDLLARYLALAYLALLIYASLHPFSGWRDTGISPLAFLEGDWPRYWTSFDLLTNIVAYLPLGFLVTLALSPLPGRWSAPIVAALFGLLVSGTLESLQTWLPSRVPSNLDLACNTLGTAIGAAFGHSAGTRFFRHLAYWHHRIVAPVPHAELGWTLLGFWVLIPLSPETLLFGVGDLRQTLGLAPALAFDADNFRLMETAVIACNVLAVGLLIRTLVAGKWLPFAVVPILLLCALGMRTLGAMLLVDPKAAFAWITPGAEAGLLIGTGLLATGLVLPVVPRLMLAALALMAGTVLVNLTPANPYSAAALAAWNQGHFLNFNGLTRIAASLWPFLTLPYLLMVSRRL